MTRREPLEGLATPPVPPRLKGRVLQTARRARTEHREAALEDRLWGSWGLRLSWLGTVAALLAVNLVIPPSPGLGLEPGTAQRADVKSLASTDVDALPDPSRSAGGDRAAVLCELQIDCTGAESAPTHRGDQA